MHPRFRVISAVALLALTACGGDDRTPVTPTTPTPTAPADPLRDAANVSGKMIGTAVQSGLLRTPQYDTVAARHFNYLTAEYEMKMGAIAQSPGFNDYAPGDAIVGFAMANGMRVKGHALVWHGSVPSWVEALSPADLRPMFENYIRDSRRSLSRSGVRMGRRQRSCDRRWVGPAGYRVPAEAWRWLRGRRVPAGASGRSGRAADLQRLRRGRAEREVEPHLRARAVSRRGRRADRRCRAADAHHRLEPAERRERRRAICGDSPISVSP